MLDTMKRKLSRCTFVITLVIAASICAFAQSRPPVILIPGLTGSELINPKTGQKVWVKFRRFKGDGLRLPISANIAANKDALIAGDIIRSVKAGLLPRVDVYGGLIDSLVAKGYREARFENPPPRGYENTLYVFPYDWRRDNVENARLLIHKINELKRKLRRPDLKFDIIAHSMGGLIARYAMMYGDTDLPAVNVPTPTFAGSKNISKLIILGTPNEGSPISLRDLINGFALVGIEVNLPFIQRMSRFDVFTIPAAYELLPAPGTIKVFDQDLNPINVDIYDPAVWDKYGWSIFDDKDFGKEFSQAEQRTARAFFVKMLDRAKQFHLALDAVSTKPPAPLYMIGSECKDTLDAAVIYQKKDGKWDSVFKADSYETPDGRKISSEDLKTKIYGPGDGVVTRRSFSAATIAAADGVESVLAPVSTTWVCEGHSKLPSNLEVQSKVLSILNGGK
jgi:pimeloyl-ACP methyl ester carboxylesterase